MTWKCANYTVAHADIALLSCPTKDALHPAGVTAILGHLNDTRRAT